MRDFEVTASQGDRNHGGGKIIVFEFSSLFLESWEVAHETLRIAFRHQKHEGDRIFITDNRIIGSFTKDIVI